MAIQEENIVFLETQVMDDVPEGGGAPTGKVVVDGQVNNVFEDISDLDRVYGRLNLRKLAVGVRSLDTDLYGGAKLAVTALPNDAALAYTLFSTGDPFDTRTAAAGRVEAYLYKGPSWPGVLLENHIAGMRAITLLQRLGTELPPIGKTLCLVQNEGALDEIEQYVRVTQVDATERTFTDADGDFVRLAVTLTLSDALRYDFGGHTASRTDGYTYNDRARVRDTQVADATRYFSARRLTAEADVGDVTVQTDAIFQQLVPSAQSETPLVNQPMAGAVISAVDAGGGRVVEVAQTAHTYADAVTVEDRRLTWIKTLDPLPAPGTLTLSFRAQGGWYTLADDGEGVLAGSGPGVGTGTLSYATGAASVTLGALPDVGSEILWVWASPAHYRQRLGTRSEIARTVALAVGEAIEPGTLTLSWLQGGASKSATGAADGTLSGDGSGFVAYATGEIRLRLALPPDPDTQLGVEYAPASTVEVILPSVSAANGLATLELGEAIKPGSLLVGWTTSYTKRWDIETTTYQWAYGAGGPSIAGAISNAGGGSGGGGLQTIPAPGSGSTLANSGTLTNLIHHVAADDGAGHIVDATGAVNYATGQVVLPVLPAISQTSWHSDPGALGKTWTVESGSDQHSYSAAPVIVRYTAASAAASPTVVLTLPLPPLTLALLPGLVAESIVPGSVAFLFGSKSYQDRGAGVLYTDVDPVTGAGVVAGEIDYLNAEARLRVWAGVSGPPVVTSCLTRYGLWSATETAFRTLLSPLKPQSLSLQITAEDGESLTATADEDGVISGDYASGAIHYEFGTASVAFGALIDEEWVERRVDPTTLRYNAVAYSYLPLDAEILGIDPVRLPSDGRVPIYRAGDVVYVLHTAETAPATLSDGDTLSAGRTRLAWARLIDADGETVSGDLYTLDRAAGTLNVPDVSGLSQPLTLRHTVADLRMVTDAQITGVLTLSRALTHHYPAGEALIASCLLFGDRRARVSALWDQATWTGVWQDSILGAAALASLNVIDYPVEVTNEGCDSDRWLLRCTNASLHAWELISENRGLVWSGTWPPYESGEPVDIAPINPRTRTVLEDGITYVGGVPYLRIPQRANGGGWSTGNCVRINSVGAIADFWIARSIQQSDEPADPAAADGCELYALGNVDRP